MEPQPAADGPRLRNTTRMTANAIRPLMRGLMIKAFIVSCVWWPTALHGMPRTHDVSLSDGCREGALTISLRRLVGSMHPQ